MPVQISQLARIWSAHDVRSKNRNTLDINGGFDILNGNKDKTQNISICLITKGKN